MSKYDLTRVISPYLDKHMVIQLLQFLKEKQIYPEHEINAATLQVTEKTNMVDFASDLLKLTLANSPSDGEGSSTQQSADRIRETLKSKRDVVVSNMSELKAACAPLLKIFEQAQLVKDLQSEKKFTIEYLREHHNITNEGLDHLYTYAKFMFECGVYSQAAELLHNYRLLSNDQEKVLNAHWGKFAAEILRRNWEGAVKDMQTLKDAIENRTFASNAALLQQRTWFIHWTLFVFFNYNSGYHPSSNGRSLMISTVLQEERYLNTIQTSCPHIMRYLTTAVITTRRKKNVLKDLVKVIQQEGYTYRDPITEFVEDLYVNFDFDGAQQKLRECGEVLQNDYFLCKYHDEFIENARLFIFETYCRIHQCIDIGMLADKLNMDQEAAERWMVNLIRNAQLDSKIDSAANHVVMSTVHPSTYQQIIEKTKGLAFKSQVLANNLEKLLNEQKRTEGKQ